MRRAANSAKAGRPRSLRCCRYAYRRSMRPGRAVFPAPRTAHLIVVLGFLCTGIAIDGAAGTALNIVALGASNTSGWGVGSQQVYPARLEAMLRAKGYEAHVANAGMSFDTTGGMLRRVDS